jgi:hypothetical protein
MQGSSVSTGWTTRIQFPTGEGISFFLATASRPALKTTQLTIKRLTGAITPGIKLPWHEATYTSPSKVVKNEWSYTSTPPYVFYLNTGYFFMVWYFVKHRDTFLVLLEIPGSPEVLEDHQSTECFAAVI